MTAVILYMYAADKISGSASVGLDRRVRAAEHQQLQCSYSCTCSTLLKVHAQCAQGMCSSASLAGPDGFRNGETVSSQLQ